MTTTGQVPNSIPTGSPTPPGKVCHLETKTVLVQEGTGAQAQYVLKPQVVVICRDGAQTGVAPPECSDGKDTTATWRWTSRPTAAAIGRPTRASTPTPSRGSSSC
jgi:hypothetical protein